MWLVVGLGNPGMQYQDTRHNVGFEVLEALAARSQWGAFRPWKRSVVCRGKLEQQDMLLMMPQTYVNLSGDAVAEGHRFYRMELADLIVVHDDLDLEVGSVKIKLGGGHGGHNGLRSIMSHLGNDFIRVRIGIGKPPSKEQGADYVLTRFDKDQRNKIDAAVDHAMTAIQSIVCRGVKRTMNEYNQKL